MKDTKKDGKSKYKKAFLNGVTDVFYTVDKITLGRSILIEINSAEKKVHACKKTVQFEIFFRGLRLLGEILFSLLLQKLSWRAIVVHSSSSNRRKKVQTVQFEIYSV